MTTSFQTPNKHLQLHIQLSLTADLYYLTPYTSSKKKIIKYNVNCSMVLPLQNT